MDRGGFDRRAARGAARLVFIVLGGGACAVAAWAQAPAPAEPAAAPSERVKRDAEKPFQWILLQSDKPRKARDAAGSAAPAPTTAARPPKPAASPTVRPAVTADAPVPTPAVGVPAPTADPAPVAPAKAEIAAVQPAPSAAPLPLPGSPVADTEADADEALQLVQQVPPSFPRAVMLDLRKGSVQVRFKVQADGTVAEPAVLKSTHPRLNKAVLAAVGQWRFKPVREPREPREAAVELGFDLD